MIHKMAKNIIDFPDANHATFYLVHNKMGYHLNPQGYRCDSFESRKDINVVTIGCSNALGWAVNIEHRYSNVFCEDLAKETGKTVMDWNVGLPAKSNDYIGRMTFSTQKLKPDIVLIGFTGMARREYWDCMGKCHDYVPANFPDVIKNKIPQDTHIHARINEMQSEYNDVSNFLKNFKMIESILKNTPWYFSFSSGEEIGGHISESIEPLISQERYISYFSVVDKANDGLHPGIESHKLLGNKILQRYLNEFAS